MLFEVTISFTARASVLALLIAGLFLLIKLLLEVRMLDKAFSFRVTGFIAVSAVVDCNRVGRARVSKESLAGPGDRHRLPLFLVICFLHHGI